MKSVVIYSIFSTPDYPRLNLEDFANKIGANIKPLEGDNIFVDAQHVLNYNSDIYRKYESAAKESGISLKIVSIRNDVTKDDLNQAECLLWYPPLEEDEDLPSGQALVKASHKTLLLPFKKTKVESIDLLVNKKVITKRGVVNCDEETLLISDKVKNEFEKAGFRGLRYWPTRDNKKKDKDFPECWGVTIENVVPGLVSETEYLTPDKPFRELSRDDFNQMGDIAIYDRKDDAPVQREFFVSSKAYNVINKLKIKDTEWMPVVVGD